MIRWLDDRMIGVLLQVLHLGSFSSIALMSLPFGNKILLLFYSCKVSIHCFDLIISIQNLSMANSTHKLTTFIALIPSGIIKCT